MHGGVQIVPRAGAEIRAFLIAQLRWERYRAARLLLVHVVAVSVVCVWLPAPSWLREPFEVASTACFLGALFAAMMEWHWARVRNRLAGTLPARGGPA